jgi:hypothetical protein
MRIPGDYGFSCPHCRTEDRWDRLFGCCYDCGYRTEHPFRRWLVWKLRAIVEMVMP